MSGIGEWERDVCLMSPLGGRLWVRRFASGDAAPEEGARRLSPDEACSVLSWLWARGEARAALAPLGGSSLFWSERLGIDLGRRSRQVDALWEVIARRLRAEQLVVWEREGSPAAVRPRPAIAPRPQPPPGGVRPLRTFIEVRLEDEAGAAIADEPVLIVEPSGGRHEPRTSVEGLVRIEALDPGVCDVSFPRIDGREWMRKGSSFRPGSDEIARHHVVEPRECMSRIAHRFAFRSGDTLWQHPCNDSLRALGRHPDILWPGDRVAILARDTHVEEAETGRRHDFATKTALRWLRLVLHDVFREPLRDTPYVLAVAGRQSVSSTTNGEGLLEEIITPATTEVTVTAADYVWKVTIADLRPLDQVPDAGREGTLRRLRNLGSSTTRARPEPALEAGTGLARTSANPGSDEDPSFDASILMHQLRVGWSPSGTFDDATCQLVREEHGV